MNVQRPLGWLSGLLLVVSTAGPARAAGEYRTVEIESLKISIDSEWAPRTAPGYLPVRFDITNLGEARIIEIVGHGSRFFRISGASRQAGYSVRRAVRLARGDRVRFTIPVPIHADNENIRFEVHEDGRVLERFNYSGFMSGGTPDAASVLVVADAGSDLGKLAAGWLRVVPGRPGVVARPAPPGVAVSRPTVTVVRPGDVGRPAPPGVVVPPPAITAVPSTRTTRPGAPGQPLDFLLPPDRLPDSWLGFTSLRAVMVGPQEWQELDDARKRALLAWTACGGDLFVVDGDAGAILPAGELAPGAAPDRVRAYFFGRIHPLRSESVGAAGIADLLSAATPLQDANWALPANRATDWGVIAARGFRLPIPGVGGVPARSYLFILLLFSVLIGPANYWLLWRRRRQVLLVLTTPLISIAFIVLLAGYVMAGEGFGVRARAVTFTMLDQVRKEAATRATASLYAAGMAPWGGLRFARDDAVFTLGPDGTGSRETQVLDLSEAQRFAAGALDARSPTNLEFIGFRPARERLEFGSTAGGRAVVNGLGTTLRALVYRTGDTVYSLTGPVLPGNRAVLTPGVIRAAGLVPRDLPLTVRFEHLFTNLPDGAYLAVLDRSPFWNPGVAALDERDSFHVVIGWVGGQP